MAVTPALREQVLRRDGACILWRLDSSHVCHDRWGDAHSPLDLDRLTLEHVKRDLRMGRRAENRPDCLVAMCWAGNVGVPSKIQRGAIRGYLAKVEAEA
jgi:hypothetical protein